MLWEDMAAGGHQSYMVLAGYGVRRAEVHDDVCAGSAEGEGGVQSKSVPLVLRARTMRRAQKLCTLEGACLTDVRDGKPATLTQKHSILKRGTQRTPKCGVSLRKRRWIQNGVVDVHADSI